jgi:hypothetical protein
MNDELGRLQKGAFELYFKTLSYNRSDLIDSWVTCSHSLTSLLAQSRIVEQLREIKSGFGGLEDACWPLVPKFGGSNPTEDVGFFRAKKFPARLPSEGK